MWLPTSIAVICFGMAGRIVSRDKRGFIFTPIFWFLLASGTYYGLGPLLYVYGNSDTINNAQNFYYVDNISLWRTNVLNLIGISIVFFVFYFVARIKTSDIKSFNINENELKKYARFFSLLGISFHLITKILRSSLGDGFIMPGLFYILAELNLSGLFLYALLYFKGRRELKTQFLTIATISAYFALSSLMKQQIIEFALALFMGYYLAGPSVKKIATAFILAISIYPVLTVVTTTARILSWNETSTSVGMVQIYDAFDLDAAKIIYDKTSDDQASWRRLSYSSAQAFAMSAFDNNLPGDTFQSAFWAFVPRIIYPDKPIITQGETFTILVLGANEAGGTGAGFFGEGYWNMGWLGVIIVSSVTGFLLAVFSKFNLNYIQAGFYHMIPIILVSLKFGYRIDDWFVSTTINSIPFILFFYLVIKSYKKRATSVLN